MFTFSCFYNNNKLMVCKLPKRYIKQNILHYQEINYTIWYKVMNIFLLPLTHCFMDVWLHSLILCRYIVLWKYLFILFENIIFILLQKYYQYYTQSNQQLEDSNVSNVFSSMLNYLFAFLPNYQNSLAISANICGNDMVGIQHQELMIHTQINFLGENMSINKKFRLVTIWE